MRAFAAALLLAGCHATVPPVHGLDDVPAVAEAPDGDEVVATVDGRPIRAGEVARQANAKRVSAKQALDDLVDAEVLAGEARRKKVKLDADAVESVRAQAVKAFLRDSFERETTVDTVPQKLVVRFYNQNRGNFDHSKQVSVLHILIQTRGLSPEKKAEAKKTAEELVGKARRAQSPAEFRALAAPGQIVEQIETARGGWVERPFSEAAFDQLKKPGDVTSVVETSYGYHVLYLLRYIPELHRSIPDAAPQIRAFLFANWRHQHFLDWTGQLAKEHVVVVHVEKLK